MIVIAGQIEVIIEVAVSMIIADLVVIISQIVTVQEIREEMIVHMTTHVIERLIIIEDTITLVPRGTYDNSRTRTTTRTYRTYRHTPYRDHVRHNRRWYNTRDYHRTIRPIYVYNNRWLRVRVTYNDGYWYGSDYPYFIYNGYRHRYSSFDTCNYELVDSYSDSVQRTFYFYSCSTGYDLCADLRDDLNYYENNYRYFCAERYNW